MQHIFEQQKSSKRVNVFQMYVKGHSQGHVIKIYGTIKKMLS